MNTEEKLVVEGLASISKQVKESMVTVTREEARFLVDSYYQMQANRITADNQIRSIMQGVDGEGKDVPLSLDWVSKNSRNQEDQIKKMLDYYTDNIPVGRWVKSITGIGPVLAAGLLANLDINKVNHYNQFWSYCGMNDNNNPWLGTEKAKKMVKTIYDKLEEEDEEVDFHFDTKFKNKMKAFFKSYSKNDNYELQLSADIHDLCKSDDTFKLAVDTLKQTFGDDMDRIADYIIRNYSDGNAVTEIIIQKACAASRRTRRVVINGLNIAIKNKTTKTVKFVRRDLESYLSKPPYNTSAKQLCFLIGESFVKVSGKDRSLYGRLYRERKAMETIMNDEFKFKDQAATALKEKKYDKSTESYKAYIEGKLPAAQIHKRAKRHAVKIFLSHLYEAMYVDKYHKKMDEEIYPIAHLDHVDYIDPEIPFDGLM